MTIPTYFFSGFLGSGKTTVLRQVLTHYKENNLRPLVVMNELGEVNVEKELFPDETLVELLNGCICCTIQDDMRQELDRFLSVHEEEIDVIFIEGTGIANPIEVVEALTSPTLVDKIALKSIIGVVDVSKYVEYSSLFFSSKEIRTVLKQQITFSTLLILNKVDLVDEQKKDKMVQKINSLKHQDVELIEAIYGKVNIQALLRERFLTNVAHLNNEIKEEPHHHHSIQALKLDQFNRVNEKCFKKWLNGQGDELIRAKGYVRFSNSSSLYHFQYASRQLQLTLAKEKVDCCVILIGHKLDKKKLSQSFYQLTKKMEEDEAGT